MTATAMDALGDYLGHLTRRGRRPQTIRDYRISLTAILAWMEERDMHTVPQEITEDDVIRIITEHHVSENTMRFYIGNLSRFLKYNGNTVIQDMGLLWNKAPTPNVRWMDRVGFERILREAHDPTDRMIVMLLAYAGLRRGEAAGLEVADVLTDRIVVTGKGHGKGKTRIVPMCRKLAQEVDRYTAVRQEILGGKQESAFLVGTARRRIGTDALGKRVRDLARRAGVEVTPHSFRRYFATEIWSRMPDKDITVLQALMGHASPDMTARYIRRNEDAMCQAVDRLI